MLGYRPAMASEISKAAADRAASVLRRWWTVRSLVPDDDVREAWSTLNAYRRLWYEHPKPAMAGVNMGLRSMAQKFPGSFVSQRLKRADRIVSKLVHFKSMRLTQMEDIGGCRVILPSLPELRRFEHRIRQVWKPNLIQKFEHDYIESPKDTGYRAVHLVVERRGRYIEVQLRTARQHRWATLVEDHENQTGEMLKRGVGDARRLNTFRILGSALAHLDRGESIPLDLADQLRHERIL